MSSGHTVFGINLARITPLTLQTGDCYVLLAVRVDLIALQ